MSDRSRNLATHRRSASPEYHDQAEGARPSEVLRIAFAGGLGENNLCRAVLVFGLAQATYQLAAASLEHIDSAASRTRASAFAAWSLLMLCTMPSRLIWPPSRSPKPRSI